MNSRPSPIASFLLALVGFYRKAISPLLPPLCRFEPSCSRYSSQAIRQHGTWRGLLLSVGRLLRCQPFSTGGYDPVPPRQDSEGS
ncbi:MAG: membrane protein insertion efficiency factor YidD [Planctomycetota bacterium]|nr:membrane protein insertion efficiency factor YidD [Planctomycetota bacterium]